MKQGNAVSRRIPLAPLLTGGGVLTAGAVLLRIFGGSPRPLLHALGADAFLPPLWLMGLCGLLSVFLLGAAAGLILFARGCGTERTLWRLRGGIWCILSCVASAAWYLLLFRSGALWFSLLLLLLSLACVVLTAVCWFRVSTAAGLLPAAYLLWELWMLFLQIAVVFHA